MNSLSRNVESCDEKRHPHAARRLLFNSRIVPITASFLPEAPDENEGGQGVNCNVETETEQRDGGCGETRYDRSRSSNGIPPQRQIFQQESSFEKSRSTQNILQFINGFYCTSFE